MTPIPETVSIALVGSGGDGIMTAGDMLFRAAAKGGWYGMMTRSVGPQIRGGEAMAFLRLGPRPVEAPSDRLDLLLAFDWNTVARFTEELLLDGDTLLIGNSASGEVPEALLATAGRHVGLDFKALAEAIPGGRGNMLAVGVVAGILGIPSEAVDKALRHQLSGKGEAAIESGTAAAAVGRKETADLGDTPRLPAAAADVPRRWIVNGNDAMGLGALRGGISFVAAYPITPATEILEWLSPRIEKRGGRLVQAEDELASINMAIGASFGGAPSLTATSGPGLALMIEGINLAISAEVPVVVVDVMRGAPSTGIPTKSEQGDLNIAVHGMFGDAPHVVVAPTSIADCLLTTQWAVHLAEVMQVPAIVLSDQHLGQSRAVVDRPADVNFAGKRDVATPDDAYQRYAVTDSGVSPMALPGTPGGQYTAAGLEHNPRGTPSSAAGDHVAQLDKRLRKVAGFDYGERWADVDGAGEVAVVTWGSMSSPVIEAARRLDPEGERIRVIVLRLLAPAQPERLAAALDGIDRVLVVEQNHGGQLYHYLRSHFGLDGAAEALCRPGPVAIRPGEVENRLQGMIGS